MTSRFTSKTPVLEQCARVLGAPFIVLLLTASVFPGRSFCQQVSSDNFVQPGTIKKSESTGNPPQEDKRIMWIVPNYRTSPGLINREPLIPKEKFKIASEDSFDRGTLALAALFAGDSLVTNATPSFGQGVKGYSRYLGTAYADFVIGNFMTEGVYPTLLHQDPRYFRRGVGSSWSRLRYAAGQIFWTHKDSGGTQFNYSEILGNSTAVAISNAYYPDNRSAPEAVSKLGIQLAVDMSSNILKEFWPEVSRKLSRKHNYKVDVTAP